MAKKFEKVVKMYGIQAGDASVGQVGHKQSRRFDHRIRLKTVFL